MLVKTLSTIVLFFFSPLFSTMVDSDDFHMRIEMGKVFLKEEGYHRALQEFSTAISMIEQSEDLTDLSPYHWRGTVHFLLDDYEAAIQDYSFVIEKNLNSTLLQLKDLIRALSGRCLCYGFLGIEESCNADFKELKILFSENDFEEEYRDFVLALYWLEGVFSEDTELDQEEDDEEAAPEEFDMEWIVKRYLSKHALLR